MLTEKQKRIKVVLESQGGTCLCCPHKFAANGESLIMVRDPNSADPSSNDAIVGVVCKPCHQEVGGDGVCQLTHRPPSQPPILMFSDKRDMEKFLDMAAKVVGAE
jgi:hypothetical protein